MPSSCSVGSSPEYRELGGPGNTNSMISEMVSMISETIAGQQPRPHVLEETKLIRTPELNALVRMCRRKDGIGARCAALHSAPSAAAAHPSPLRTATET